MQVLAKGESHGVTSAGAGPATCLSLRVLTPKGDLREYGQDGAGLDANVTGMRLSPQIKVIAQA